jgi:hypothetical protein
MATLASVILFDIFSNRPAAGEAGRLFFASDTGTGYRDNGSTWNQISTGGGGGGSSQFVLLESHTASASTELDFTSWASSSYDYYKIVTLGLVTAGANGWGIRFSTNGGSSYDAGANYSRSFSGVYWNGATATTDIGGASGASNIAIDLGNNPSANNSYNAEFNLYLPSSTLLYKNIQGLISLVRSDGLVMSYRIYGNYQNTAAVNAFNLVNTAGGNFASGTVRIYGISNS